MSDAMIRAFLDRIRAEPEEDVHRLVLADWLEEHDEAERAEFLRLQVQLARTGDYDPRWPELTQRQQELREQLEQRLEALHSLPVMWQFQLRPDGLLAGSIKAEHLSRTEIPSKEWAWLVELRVHGRVAIPQILQGLSLPHLDQVSNLELFNNGLGEAGISRLADWPGLARLAALTLRANNIGPSQAIELVRSRHLARLAVLDLAGNPIGDEGARGLARSPHLERLTHLGLSETRITHRGVEALASSAVLARLTSLDLSGNPFGNAGALALASSPYLERLTRLVVADDRHLGQQGEAALRKRFGSRLLFRD